MKTKVCSKCGEERPATKEYFGPDKKNKDGLYSWCRKCKYAASANWARKNRDVLNKYQRKFHKTIRGYISHLVSHIKDRCNSFKEDNYEYYGGRGIQCCFTSNELFTWVIKNNIEPRGRDIHRINNDGNYTLDNIQFIEHGLHLSLHAGLRKQGL